MCKDGAGQGMLHGPCRSSGTGGDTLLPGTATPGAQDWGAVGVPLPGCPMAPLPAQGSGRVHARITQPFACLGWAPCAATSPPSPRLRGHGTGCPHSSSTPGWTVGKEFRVPTCRRLLGPAVPPWWHCGSRRRYHPKVRRRGSRGAGEKLRGGPRQSSSGPAVLFASRCFPQPQPVPRCHRRCFAASLREAAASSTGSHSPAGSSAGTGASPSPARGCADEAPGTGSRHSSDLSPAPQALHHVSRAAAPLEGLGCIQAQLQRASKNTSHPGAPRGRGDHLCFKLKQDCRGSSCTRSAQLLPLGRDRGPALALHQGSANSPETAGAGVGPWSCPPCTGGKEKGSKTPVMPPEGGRKPWEEKGRSCSPDTCAKSRRAV